MDPETLGSYGEDDDVGKNIKQESSLSGVGCRTVAEGNMEMIVHVRTYTYVCV